MSPKPLGIHRNLRSRRTAKVGPFCSKWITLYETRLCFVMRWQNPTAPSGIFAYGHRLRLQWIERTTKSWERSKGGA
jgi:hypothetical protein